MKARLLACTLALSTAACVHRAGVVDSAPYCKIGAYRSARGDVLVLTRAPEPGLRYVLLDGHTGVLRGPPDGEMTAGPGWSEAAPVVVRARLGACANDALSLSFGSEATETWSRLPLRMSTTRFESGGATLTGQLIEPVGTQARPPLLVIVHGSEPTPAVGWYPYPYLFAAQGISVFVFNKRGTGDSEGTYTQNFYQLADDVVHASREARRLAAGRYSRFGLFGGSQGGWIAPLAAPRAQADFVVAGFSLVATPLEEDAEQVVNEMRRRGYGPDAVAAAREVTDATAAVVASHFRSSYERLTAVKARYANEPWLREIRGEYTGDLLRASEAELRAHGRERYDNLGVPWRHDALTVLHRLDTPQLWIMARDDAEAPSATSIERLRALQHAGKPIDIAIFPDTDHGIMEFVEGVDGARRRTRFADGYFRLIADWIRGAPLSSYGRATLESHPRH